MKRLCPYNNHNGHDYIYNAVIQEITIAVNDVEYYLGQPEK